jgi:hypothetical protein
MYSQRQFTPGNNSNASRIINYIAEYNTRYPNSTQLNCLCNGNIHNKNVLGSESPSQRIPYKQYVAYLSRTNLGGTTQYGNYYLGEPLNLNYLGRNAGMPGGSGSPPVNKF